MKAARYILLVVGSGLLWTASSLANVSNNAAYYCVVEAAGGLTYDALSKRWIGSVFRPDGKFILRMTWLQTRTEKSPYFGDQVDDYSVTITDAGTNFPRPCVKIGSNSREISVYPNSTFFCTNGITDFAFNPSKGRFLKSYMIGFVGGTDNNDDTPAMSGGTCTKID